MSSLQCSQCGRAAPTDLDQLRSWMHGDLIAKGQLDELTAAMLLCPDCVAEDVSREYDEGEAG